MTEWLKKAWLVFRLDTFRNRHQLVLMIDILLLWPVLCMLMLKIRMLPWDSVSLLLESNDVVLLALGALISHRVFLDAHDERMMISAQKLPASAGQQIAAKWLLGYVLVYGLWALFGALYEIAAGEVLVPIMHLQVEGWHTAAVSEIIGSALRTAGSEAAFFALWQALFFYCSLYFRERRFLRAFMVSFFGYILFVQLVYLTVRWLMYGHAVYSVTIQSGGLRLVAQVLNPFTYFPQLSGMWLIIQFVAAAMLWLAAVRRLRKTAG